MIKVMLHGEPSNLDIYDLRPGAPAETQCEFEPFATNVPTTVVVASSVMSTVWHPGVWKPDTSVKHTS